MLSFCYHKCTLNVISRKGLEERIAAHPDCGRSALAWLKVARKAQWRSLDDVRGQFPSADQVGVLLIFNLRGNRYGLIVRVSWEAGMLFVKELISHAEYDRKEWLKWLN